jgi:eukaryotic-like serine/threonine-protein kinase
MRGSIATDIYASGVSAYRLLNGDTAFFTAVNESSNVPAAIARGAIPNRGRWLPHVHTGLRRVVTRSLNADPAKRYASASDFRLALEKQRPNVSWGETQEVGVMSWVGTRGGTDAFRARLHQVGDSYKFEISKSGPAGWRNVRSEWKSGSLEQVLPWAEQVLTRIAVSGR